MACNFVKRSSMFGLTLQTSIIKCHLGPIPCERADELARIANDHSVWINVRDTFPYPYTMEHALTFVKETENAERSVVWGVYDSDILCGVIGLHRQFDVYRHNAELGYWLGSDFRNKGLATASVEAVVRFAFGQTNLKRIYAGVFEDNQGSVNVLLRNDFNHEATLKKAVFKNERFADELIFSRLKD